MKAVGFATLLLLTACAATVSSAAGSADCEAKGCAVPRSGAWAARGAVARAFRHARKRRAPPAAGGAGCTCTCALAAAAPCAAGDLAAQPNTPPGRQARSVAGAKRPALPITPAAPRSFTGLAACSDCDLFEEVVKDEELAADCRGCCVKDAAAVRYAKATLEICPFKKRGLPQVGAPAAAAHVARGGGARGTPAAPAQTLLCGAGARSQQAATTRARLSHLQQRAQPRTPHPPPRRRPPNLPTRPAKPPHPPPDPR